MIKGLKNSIKKLAAKVFDLALQFKEEKIRQKFSLPGSVRVYGVSIEGNVSIGESTYINEGSRVDSGASTSIKIGKHCAIGRYVHITSKTHDLRQPTTDDLHNEILHKEADVIVGDCVWMGDYVMILPGVTIGNYAVIGAHPVVTKNVSAFEIVAGVPAKHIRFNETHPKFSNKSGE